MTVRLDHVQSPAPTATTPEADLVSEARDGSESAVRELIRRLNPRLFRIARGIVASDAEAEDVVQEAYLAAFAKLDSFRGEASFSTWITRIAINSAKMQRRRDRPKEMYDTVAEDNSSRILALPGAGGESMDATIGRAQVRAIAEKAVADLPSGLRAVFILREAEGLSTAEVAEALQINPITVKTRLFRARTRLRTALEEHARGGFEAIFPFDGLRCVRMADRILVALKAAGKL